MILLTKLVKTLFSDLFAVVSHICLENIETIKKIHILMLKFVEII